MLHCFYESSPTTDAAYLNAGDAQALAEMENAELREQNLKIKDELKASRLNEKQTAMVKANAAEVDDEVPPHFKLDWKVLKFHDRLGSGSFGDCYKGAKGGKPVAIKRMRAALTDQKGFKAFCKEVRILAAVDHINIVSLVGYVLHPVLLIVMDFVSGGTLADFIEGIDAADPPSMRTMMKIFKGTVKGMAYLHGTEPMPILHRDIKSENILLTRDLDPRIADLGEARAMAEDRAMTSVGTNGYTAPEVLRGEHYGTSADVFSFAIVMCELVTMRPPYSDLMKNEDGELVLKWDQVRGGGES